VREIIEEILVHHQTLRRALVVAHERWYNGGVESRWCELAQEATIFGPADLPFGPRMKFR
jgi:hypothetical protein